MVHEECPLCTSFVQEMEVHGYNNNNIICKLIKSVLFHLLIQDDLTCEESQQQESQELF